MNERIKSLPKKIISMHIFLWEYVFADEMSSASVYFRVTYFCGWECIFVKIIFLSILRHWLIWLVDKYKLIKGEKL